MESSLCAFDKFLILMITMHRDLKIMTVLQNLSFYILRWYGMHVGFLGLPLVQQER